jgi:hypothetical protein
VSARFPTRCLEGPVAPVRLSPGKGQYKCVRRAWSMRYHTQKLLRRAVLRFAIRKKCLGPVAHEAVRFTANHAIAFAYSRFETSAIEDGDTAAMVTNQTGVLQTGSLL